VSEGTVDDEIAKRLALGEDNQDELEMARLELQAMNSERFRHRFLDRSRPWILQHLEELLTPRTLQMPGPDGRANIEYIRDVYADLMNMGLGKRKVGDREDISSDSGDELKAQRREWTSHPVEGASKEIALLWLGKARQRKTCMKLVAGYVKRMTKDACEQCGRNVEGGAIMTASLVDPDTGEVDDMILNKHIDDFNAQQQGRPFDPNMWKAFFRQHATFKTRCDKCIDSMEQKRLAERNAALRKVGGQRVARAQDISSDEDDDMQVFEALVVPRSSAEGKILVKWLTAARKRLGGTFPRPAARVMMEDYKRRMRDKKLKGGEKKKTPSTMKKKRDGFMDKELVFSQASKAIAIKWLRKARASASEKRRARAVEITNNIENALARMPEKEDWFYTSELRVAGEGLQKEGEQIQDMRQGLETEAVVRLQKLDADALAFAKAKRATLAQAEVNAEAKVQKEEEKTSAKIKMRETELQHQLEQQEKEMVKAKAVASKKEGARIEEQFKRQKKALEDGIAREKTKLQNKMKKIREADAAEIESKRRAADQSILRRNKETENKKVAIQREIDQKVESREGEWRKRSLVWLNKARRKFEMKAKADAEAGKRPSQAESKKARNR
jgi:hypothetical protein